MPGVRRTTGDAKVDRALVDLWRRLDALERQLADLLRRVAALEP